MKAIRLEFWYGPDESESGRSETKVELVVSGAHAAAGNLLDVLLGTDLGESEVPRKIIVEPLGEVPDWVTRKSDANELVLSTNIPNPDSMTVAEAIRAHIRDIRAQEEHFQTALEGIAPATLRMTVSQARAAGKWQP